MASLASRFEDFAKRLFISLGYELQRNPVRDVDLTFRAERENSFFLVEVKLYRSQTIASVLLRNAAIQLAFARLSSRAPAAILFTNLVIDSKTRGALEKQYSIQIYDYSVISSLVGQHLALRQELEDIGRESYTFHSGPVAIPPEQSRLQGPPNHNRTRRKMFQRRCPRKGRNFAQCFVPFQAGKRTRPVLRTRASRHSSTHLRGTSLAGQSKRQAIQAYIGTT